MQSQTTATKKQVWLIALCLLISASIAAVLFTIQPSATIKPKANKAIQVKLGELKPAQSIQVHLRGFIQAGDETLLSASSNSQLIYRHPNFFTGGSFKQGERLFALDKQALSLSKAKQEVQLNQAKLNLKQWQTKYPNKNRYNPAQKARLTLLQSQVELAQLALAQTQSSLDASEYHASFDGLFTFVSDRTSTASKQAATTVLKNQVIAKISPMQFWQLDSQVDQQSYAWLKQLQANHKGEQALQLEAQIENQIETRSNTREHTEKSNSQVYLQKLSDSLDISQQHNISLRLSKSENFKLGEYVSLNIQLPLSKVQDSNNTHFLIDNHLIRSKQTQQLKSASNKATLNQEKIFLAEHIDNNYRAYPASISRLHHGKEQSLVAITDPKVIENLKAYTLIESKLQQVASGSLLQAYPVK